MPGKVVLQAFVSNGYNLFVGIKVGVTKFNTNPAFENFQKSSLYDP